MVITLEQAKRLKIGTIIYHISNRNADGTSQRWKINGLVRLWKRNPFRINIPLKNGLFNYGYLDEHNLDVFTLEEKVME